MASGDTKTEAMLNALGNGGSADEFRGCCNTKTQQYILDAIDRVQNVEDEVEELKNNPDVVDIVDTYADLQAYDTQHLTENDIIRVLQDETHDDNSTYYRFTKNPDTWTFIGEISGGGSSVTVVQTTGTSTTDVMSQNATTSMIYADPSLMNRIRIGQGASSNIADNGIEIGHESGVLTANGIAIGTNATVRSFSSESIAIGTFADARSEMTEAIGYYSYASGEKAAALGGRTSATHSFSVALGAGATTSAAGEVNIGTGSLYPTKGYANSNYRLLTGLYDPQTAHDAATKGYVDAHAGGNSIKELTTADINWPVDNPTGIALWKLAPGIYRLGASGLDVWFCNGTTYSVANSSVDGNWTQYLGMFVVRPRIYNGSPEDTDADIMAFSSNPSSNYAYLQWRDITSSGNLSGSVLKVALEKEFVPLSGAGAPTTTTPASFLGEIYIDTTNEDAYVNVHKQSSNYIWKKITP